MKNKILLGISFLMCQTASYADPMVNTSTIALVEIREKVVELHITFAPPPTAEVKKQRKLLATKAGRAICSGSFISSYGHILTAKHCVADTEEIIVVTSDGQEYVASTIAVSTNHDLAIIQIGRFKTPYFNLADNLGQGQQVYILGSPLGLTGTLTAGIISKLGGDVLFLDCTALPGNSGGPIITAKGELAGVLNAIIIVLLGPSHLSVAQSKDAVMFFFYQLSGGR